MKKQLLKILVGVPFTLAIGYLIKMEEKTANKVVDHYCSSEEEPKNN